MSKQQQQQQHDSFSLESPAPPLTTTSRHSLSHSQHKRRNSHGSMTSSFSNLFKPLNPAHHRRHRVVKKAAGVVEKYVHDLQNKSPYLGHVESLVGSSPLAGGQTIDLPIPHALPEEPQSVSIPAPLATHKPAQVTRQELVLGKLVGEGQFCQVWDISKLCLQTDTEMLTESEERQALLTNSNKLVVKQLKKSLTKDPSQFTLAAADLVVEAQYLSRLQHPHIVALKGMTQGHLHTMKTTGRYDGYFFVMDKLVCTLDQRIAAWQQGQDIAATGDNGGMITKTSSLPSYATKLEYALQMASALQYLHQRRIIFRDCKPRNIGFDMDGSLKLFDFGLCRELPPPLARPRQQIVEEEDEDADDDDDVDDRHNDDDQEEEDDEDHPLQNWEESYHMTKVGTRRYCAVELFISGKYNCKADTYSWAMTVYEMLTCQKPYASLTDADHQEYVCRQGRRPNPKPLLMLGLKHTVPPILTLLRQAWEQYVTDRIDMETVVMCMQEMVDDCHAATEGSRHFRRHLSVEEDAEPVATTDKNDTIATTTITNKIHVVVEETERKQSPPEKDVNISVTSVTVEESDQDLLEEGNDNDGRPVSRAGARGSTKTLPTSNIFPTTKADKAIDGNVTDDEDDNNDSEKADIDTANDSGSIKNMIVDLVSSATRDSLHSQQPSLEAVSHSEVGLDDSISISYHTGSVAGSGAGSGGRLDDGSLSTIAYEEFLRPRNRVTGLNASGGTHSLTMSNSGSSDTAEQIASLEVPATVTTRHIMASAMFSAVKEAPPPALARIVSVGAQDDSSEQNEEGKGSKKKREAPARIGAVCEGLGIKV